MRTLLKKMVLGCTMLAFAAPATMGQMPMDPSYNYKAQNKQMKKQNKQMKKQNKMIKKQNKQMKKQHKLQKKQQKYQNQGMPQGEAPMHDGLANEGVHDMGVDTSGF